MADLPFKLMPTHTEATGRLTVKSTTEVNSHQYDLAHLPTALALSMEAEALIPPLDTEHREAHSEHTHREVNQIEEVLRDRADANGERRKSKLVIGSAS
jgi:hypothetical protein